MTEFADKARSIGVSLRRGTSNRKRVVDDRDGSTAGIETEHWDDRQDAKAFVKTVHVKAKRVRSKRWMAP